MQDYSHVFRALTNSKIGNLEYIHKNMPCALNTAVKRLPFTRANFARKIVLGKTVKTTIYEKQVVSVIENSKRKSNYAKGKLKTFRT